MTKYEITYAEQERAANRADAYMREAAEAEQKMHAALERARYWNAIANGECEHGSGETEAILDTGTVRVYAIICEDCGVTTDRVIDFWHPIEGAANGPFVAKQHFVSEMFDARPVDFVSEMDFDYV